MTLRIVCSADEAYLAPASAMLHSLYTFHPHADVTLFHGGDLSADGLSKVQQTAAQFGAEVRLLEVDRSRLERFPAGRFPPEIWTRVLLPELLDGDRILYIDVDTIVMDSLDPLWSTALDDAYFAAVANPIYRFMGDYPRVLLHIEDRRDSINSGVLLLNLALMRTTDTAQVIENYARAHPDNQCPDQDALSALFHNRHVRLAPRWNAQTTLFELPDSELPFTSAELDEARRNPAIVHFIGPFKPWHRLCTHPYQNEYFRHLAATPWPRPPIEGRTLLNSVLRHLPPDWINRGLRWEDAVRRGRRRLGTRRQPAI